MKNPFSFRFRSKKAAKSPQGNRILSPEEIAAQEAQKMQLAEQQAKEKARKKAQDSARSTRPRNRIASVDKEVDAKRPNSFFQRFVRNGKRSPQEKRERQNRQSIGPVIRDVLSGEFLTREGVTRHIPYLLFVSALFIAYIAMGYQFERIEREKLTTKRQLKELSAEFKTLKAEFETELQQSTVEQNIADLGLKQTVEPPFLLEYQPVAP